MFDSLNRGSDRRQTPKSEAAYCSISVSDVQPAMGPGSEDSHPCWMSWLLTFLSLVLGVRSTGTKSSRALGSGTWNSEGPSFLKQIRGGSVLFHVIPKPETELEKVSWELGPESDFTVLLCFKRGADSPTWVSLQDKDKQRVHVPNMTSLRIEKLTLTDSGQYRARSTYTGGKGFTQVFHLTVCEPVPQPQMQAKPLSITANWCNVTLECPVTGATEDLNVTWEGKDLPGGVELRGTWGPVSNTSTLSVSLPLSQPNASITCVISNSVDQKNASLALRDVCIHESHGLTTASRMGSLFGVFGAVLLTLGAGLCLWKTRRKKKKLEPGRGAGLHMDDKDNGGGIHYAELSRQGSPEGKDKRFGEQHLGEEPTATIYSEIHNPGQATYMI
ncbi:T-lymphocyte surface antigen Ly-9-like isoform X2 [Tamandua tetradactyla]|uniref:T-lymphocyte surface antigen Ly-9-like isoform X2 n=1 Tax=Tamandua tetradactyla TaxID=48850 RepID=UPI00405393F4